MYKFRDTTKQKHYRNLPFIPTSAMSYDGAWLEELIEGYQTLTVEGREMYSLSFESQEMQVGGVITNVKYPPRELTIKYKLEDRDPRALQEKFDTLKAFLIRQEDVPIIFYDDLEYTFYGRFQTADTVAGDTNSIISSFTVLCSDPFKHGKTQIVKNKVIEVLPYPVKPDKLSFKLPADETGYSVAMMGVKDDKGDQGTPGKPGADGKTPYFHTAYANSADGTDGFTTIYPNLNLLTDSKYFKNKDVAISELTTTIGSPYSTIVKENNDTYLHFSKTESNYTDWFRAYIIPGSSVSPNFPNVDVKPNSQYTFSVWLKGTGTHTIYAYSNWTIPNPTALTATLTDKWTRYSLTVVTSATIPTKDAQFFIRSNIVGSEINLKYPKVEPGSTATPWMPSDSEVTTADWPSYIGQYTDFTQADSTNPSDYTWSLDGIAGKTDVGIKTTVITYAISTSGTTAPTTGWASSVPSLVKGQYLWTKTVWTYTDNSSETGYSVTYIVKDGNNDNDGIAGNDGTDIKTTTIMYAGSTSGTTAPTSGWSSTVPTVAAGQYLWTKTVWVYTDDTMGLLATDGNYRLKSSQAKKGDLLEFDFQTGDTFLNGQVNNNLLDLDSDFKNIRLTTGTDFSSSNYELTIQYRKAVL